jgi:hypothetical protein
MRHLSAERLAAVADEHPTPEEAAHLAQCAPCAADRDAHRRLIAGAALARDRTVAPRADWGAISARLRAEGIIRAPDESDVTAAPAVAPAPAVLPFSRATATLAPAAAMPATVMPPTRRRAMPVWAMRVAAGLALVAGGALAGRVSAPGGEVAMTSTAAPATDSGPVRLPDGTVSQVAQTREFRFASTDEARRAMLNAEKTYREALRYLAEHDTTLVPPVGNPVEAYRERLAALDQAVEASRRALSVAPTSQQINDIYLASVSAREATLRQIDDALPVDTRVTRF